MNTKPLVVVGGMDAWKDHLKRAIRQMGSQPKLAKAMGCSQSKISWLLLTARDLSAEDALAIHRATGGAVSASDLRPDIWPTEQHVPQIHEVRAQ